MLVLVGICRAPPPVRKTYKSMCLLKICMCICVYI